MEVRSVARASNRVRPMLSDIRGFYPPTPSNVPPLLTKPTGPYRLQAALVVASLFLFILVYFGLIVIFGGFSLWAITRLWNLEDFRDFGPGGAALTLIFLALGGFSSGLL